MKYQHLILAGSFDHLHDGHKHFIKEAVKDAVLADCGLLVKPDNTKIYPEAIESYKLRLKNLKSFLEEAGLNKKVKIFPLINIFEPAESSKIHDAIAATEENLKNVKLINEKRQVKGLPPLVIVKINLLKASDKKNLSATRIRLGQINDQGFVFKNLLVCKNFSLPHKNRPFFKKPLGKVLISDTLENEVNNLTAHPPLFLICVGDIAVQTFLKKKIKISLSIFDKITQRRPAGFDLSEVLKKTSDSYFKAENKPGTISKNTNNILVKIFPKHFITGKTAALEISGEEDLIVLSCLFLAPLKTWVYYGIRNKGLVKVEVSERIKSKALKLLSKLLSG